MTKKNRAIASLCAALNNTSVPTSTIGIDLAPVTGVKNPKNPKNPKKGMK